MGRRLNIANISRPADNRNNYLIYQCHANSTGGDASGVASIEVWCKDMFVLFSKQMCLDTGLKRNVESLNCLLTLDFKQGRSQGRVPGVPDPPCRVKDPRLSYF